MELEWNEYKFVENPYEIKAVFLEDIDLSQYEKDIEFLKQLKSEKDIILIIKSKNNISLGISSNYGYSYDYVLLKRNIKEGSVLIEYGYKKYILVNKDDAKEILKIIEETKSICEKEIEESKYDIDFNFILLNELSVKDKWTKEEIEKLKSKIIDTIRKEIENKKKKEKEIENKNECNGEITEEKIWDKRSYIKYKLLNGNWIEINKNKLKYLDLEIELNVNFNEIFIFYDVNNLIYSDKKSIIEKIMKGINSKYIYSNFDSNINKDIIVKIKNGNNKLKFTFKKEKGGIYFEDKRIHKNKFYVCLNYILKNLNNVNKDTIEIINKMSGVMIDILNTKELIIASYFKNHDLKIDIEFKCEKKDVWKVKINDKEYTTNWNNIRKYFVYGHNVYNRISEAKFLQFLEEIGEENSVEVYKEILFFSKL